MTRLEIASQAICCPDGCTARIDDGECQASAHLRQASAVLRALTGSMPIPAGGTIRSIPDMPGDVAKPLLPALERPVRPVHIVINLTLDAAAIYRVRDIFDLAKTAAGKP